MITPRLESGLARRLKLPGTGTEERDLVVVADLPEPIGVGRQRMSGERDDRSSHKKASALEVPHHPRECGVPEEHVTRTDLVVQSQYFDCLLYTSDAADE